MFHSLHYKLVINTIIMVVCKFFQQGSCRFGQNCKFEHVYSSKYSYHAPTQNQPQQPAAVTDEQLVHQVQSDIQALLNGRQWLLSGYAPFKEKPALPGLTDLSPEEARLFIYEAKANNTVDQAIGYINNITEDMRRKYEQLLQPSPQMVKVLRSLYKGEIVTSPFTSHQPAGFGSNSAASSIFRSAVQSSPQSSIFGQNTQNTSPFGQSVQNSSPFGQTPQNNSPFGQTPQNNSPFGQTPQPFSQTPQNSVFGQNTDPAKSLFAQASQNISSPPNQNVFGQAQDAGRSIFASAQQQNAASFWSQQTAQTQPEKPSNAFQSSLFQQPGQIANVFGQPTNVFQQQTVDDPGVYSKVEELSAEDIEMYKSDRFKLGFIPELPPPHELCI